MVKWDAADRLSIQVSLEKAIDPANDRVRLHCTRPDPNGLDATLDLDLLDAELLIDALRKELSKA